MRVYIANKPMLQTQLNHKKELSTQKKAGEGEKEQRTDGTNRTQIVRWHT